MAKLNLIQTGLNTLSRTVVLQTYLYTFGYGKVFLTAIILHPKPKPNKDENDNSNPFSFIATGNIRPSSSERQCQGSRINGQSYGSFSPTFTGNEH